MSLVEPAGSFKFGFYVRTGSNTPQKTNVREISIQGLKSPYAYWDTFNNPHMDMGIVQSLTMCIWVPLPYGKLQLGFPYAKFTIWGYPYAYRDPSTHTGRGIKKL